MEYMMAIFFLLMMGMGQTTYEHNQYQNTYMDTRILPGTTGNLNLVRSKAKWSPRKR